MQDIFGKVAFITGGVSGIGLGIAKAFCDAGMRVVVTYRNRQHRDAALSQLPAAQVRAMELDITDRAAVAAAAAETERIFGRIHILCNNAGVNVLGHMDQATYED